MSNAFTEDGMQQLIVQYACRTTPIDEQKTQTWSKILTKAKGIWPDLFQREIVKGSPAYRQLEQGNPELVYAANRTLFIGGSMAEAPTLLVTRNTFTIAVPRKVGGQEAGIYARDPWLKRERGNERARQITLMLQEELDITVHRTGKIAEMVFFPIGPDDLSALFQRLFGSLEEKPKNVQADLTFFRPSNNRDYNFLLRLVAKPQKLTDPCPVLVKVDINNRDMSTGLHPNDITQVYEVFDAQMPDWVLGLLGGGN